MRTRRRGLLWPMGVAPDVPPTNVIGTPTMQAGMRNVISAVKGGSGRAIAFVGDSLTAGYSSGGASRYQAPCAVAAAYCNSHGVPTRDDAWFGNNNLGFDSTAWATQNPSLTFGTNWAIQQWANFAGGCFFDATSATGPMTFTPRRAADRFDFYVASNTGDGQFTISDASGTLGTVRTDLLNFQMDKITISRATASTLPITIQHNGVGGEAYLGGIVPRNSGLGELNLINLGAFGWQGSQYATHPGNIDAGDTLDKLNADFHIFQFGDNEHSGGLLLSDLITNLTNLTTQANARSNNKGCQIVVPNAARVDQGTNIGATWIAGIKSFANTNNYVCVDHNGVWGTYEAHPEYYLDTTHPNTSGYSLLGTLDGQAILW